METFSFDTSFKIHRAIQCVWPLIILGALIAYSSVVSDFGGDVSGYFSEGWMPLILIGSLGWLILEIVWTVKVLGFSVELSEESIRVGKKEIPWEDIVNAEYKTAFGKKPSIILSTSSDELRIPGAIEGLDYIKGVVKRKVKSNTSNSSELSNTEKGGTQ